MAINSITDSSVWMWRQAGFCQQTSQVSSGIQDPRDDGESDSRVYHHHRGGMGHALMQTLKQLLQSLPADAGAQSATAISSDRDRSAEESQVNAVRTDMHNFMHALFQAIRSQEHSSASNTSPYPSGFDGTKFESGLSSLISLLNGDSGSDDAHLSDLQNAFNTLVQDLQNGGTGGSSGQPPQSVSLQDFLTTLQHNLLSSHQSVSARGNVVNTQG
jgi:hypothetical protein